MKTDQWQGSDKLKGHKETWEKVEMFGNMIKQNTHDYMYVITHQDILSTGNFYYN